MHHWVRGWTLRCVFIITCVISTNCVAITMRVVIVTNLFTAIVVAQQVRY